MLDKIKTKVLCYIMPKAKRFIFIALCVVILLSILCMSVGAVSGVSEPLRYSARSVRNSGTSLTIEGVPYYIPSDITIGYGYTESGTYVGICQQALNRIDYKTRNSLNYKANCNCGDVDYLFGPKTEWAIMQFQTYNNTRMAGNPQLDVDGICGILTWERIAFYCD